MEKDTKGGQTPVKGESTKPVDARPVEKGNIDQSKEALGKPAGGAMKKPGEKI